MKKTFSVLAIAFALTACETPNNDNFDAYDQQKLEEGAKYENVKVSYEPGSQEDLTENAGDVVYFDFDSSTLSADAKSTLNAQAEWLKKNDDVKVIVYGHCDERGTREYNLALGDRRAESVKKYLVRSGVAANRIEAISLGKERPAVVGDNEESHALNRRAEVVVK